MDPGQHIKETSGKEIAIASADEAKAAAMALGSATAPPSGPGGGGGQLFSAPPPDHGKGKGWDAPNPSGFDLKAKLDSWCMAKLDRDFTTADRIRDELRQMGVEAEKERPGRPSEYVTRDGPKGGPKGGFKGGSKGDRDDRREDFPAAGKGFVGKNDGGKGFGDGKGGGNEGFGFQMPSLPTLPGMAPPAPPMPSSPMPAPPGPHTPLKSPP